MFANSKRDFFKTFNVFLVVPATGMSYLGWYGLYGMVWVGMGWYWLVWVGIGWFRSVWVGMGLYAVVWVGFWLV